MVNAWHDVEIGKDSPRVVNTIIEVPLGSQQKYELDKKTGLIKLDRALYSSVHYPGNYGFIPMTLAEDNDPLDIIIVGNKEFVPLCIVEMKVLGVLKMVDNNEQDDKIIGVHVNDPRYADDNCLKDIPQHRLLEIKHFFETYKELQGVKLDIMDFGGVEEAWEIIRKSEETYKEEFLAKAEVLVKG